MSNRRVFCILAMTCLAAVPAIAQSTPTCGPLDNGRVADVFYKGTAIFFDPVVTYRYDSAVLTISGPCEDVVKTFKPGEEIFFDLTEIQRVLDGSYTWELRFMPAVDPAVREALEASRGTSKEQSVWWSFWQKGAIPADPSVDSASFSVVEGQIIDPNALSERSATLGGKASTEGVASSTAQAALVSAAASDGTSGVSGGPVLAPKGTVLTNADGIIRNSLCVGFDCASTESFGFDTIRLKENNTRIQFNDTSASTFPTNNWQIRANSSSSGGTSFLGFVDQGADGVSETGTAVFGVEAHAPSHGLWVESDGDVGLGTSNPVVRLHVVDSDTPALRLDQNASAGFATQVWDVAGNETNFFVRDATNGSTLPFRIRPGAPSSSIDIAASGNVGMGTALPSAALHVRRTNGSARILVEEASTTSAARTLFQLVNNGAPTLNFQNNAGTGSWSFFHANNDRFVISRDGTGTQEFAVAPNGDVFVNGVMVHSSSREKKEGFAVLDPQEVLAKVDGLPITSWAYKKDDGEIRHVGPMAEDFHAAFGLGSDDRYISDSDTAGVALAAIQGLNRLVQQRDEELAALKDQNAELGKRLAALEELVGNLEPHH